MFDFKDIIITNIDAPFVVHSKKGQSTVMTQRRCFGLSLCKSGQITYHMNGKRFVSNKSNATILPQGATYSLNWEDDGYFPVINFYCENFICNEITVLPLKNPTACLNTFEMLNKLYNNGTRFDIFSCFYKLLGEVSSVSENNTGVLTPAIRHIESNLSDTALSNQQLAHVLGISEVYLRKLFLKELNVTPKQYVLKMRMQKAKQLLIDTPYSVTAIAEECGFSSLYHFCRAFKQHTGLSPTEYTLNNRALEI